jgi:hypothetical protein
MAANSSGLRAGTRRTMKSPWYCSRLPTNLPPSIENSYATPPRGFGRDARCAGARQNACRGPPIVAYSALSIASGKVHEEREIRLPLAPPREVARLTNRGVQALEGYAWPGNVRELASVICAAILARDGRLAIGAVLARAGNLAPARGAAVRRRPRAVETEGDRKKRERANIEAALAASGGKIYGPGGAAELLGTRPTTLASRTQALGIRPRSRR